MPASAVERLLEGIRDADVSARDAFDDDAIFDATVPGWRFTLRGAASVNSQLDRWFAHPGVFEELERVPMPSGELVRFFLVWEENGIPCACHQTHLLTMDGDKITSDTVFCGGRWPASLLAEMEAAGHGQ